MAHSDWTDIRARVPQDSILGPLLVLVFINGIVNDIASNIRLFEDDTSLYIIVDNPVRSAELLNADLEKFHFGPILSSLLLTQLRLNLY